VRADVTIGESTGHLDVVLPATVARSLCRTDSDSPRAGSPDPSHTGLLLRRLMYNELLLQVQCELRGASLSLRDLMGLRPGTILDLGMPFDSPVTLTANSTPKFTGWIAQEESTMSVTITSLR
jgi:flagellar motor switch protein FliM